MCSICSRRAWITGGVAALTLFRAVSTANSSDRTIACGFSQQDFDKYRSQMRPMPSGDDQKFHKPLVGELKNILRVMPVAPGFQYIEAHNAFALKESLVTGTTGTVLIGVGLVRDLLQPQDGGIAVAGTLAHECAHIYQYYSEYHDMLAGPTPRLLELHADLLAGFYIAKKAGLQSDRISVFSRALIQGGTYSVGGPNDHGTPGERNVAMDKGLLMGLAGKTFEVAAREGATYVRKL